MRPTSKPLVGSSENNSELLYSREPVMFNENQDVDDYRSTIEEWAVANQGCVDGLTL